ncbi:hypothetical protein N7475_009761 [Penicillium sp. IBT 31633x]|nr:hypothetical protein N7475_009761 [Penicillium sp. IBT 31633x]
MKQFTSVLAFAGIISLVNGHGFVTSPKARLPGPAMGAACGKQAASNQESDKYGSIQDELKLVTVKNGYNAAECNPWLCKGYQFADNEKNVYSYKAGEKVHFNVDIRIPHTGVANISIVDTSSNSVIGAPLISWPVYASVATGAKADETSFSVTIPDDLEDQCATAGDCVLQWYWYTQSLDQTYESCIDFTVNGYGSGLAAVTSSKPLLVVARSRGAAATSAQIAPLQTPKSTPIAVQPTATFATSVRQSATSAEREAPTAVDAPDADASALPYPADSIENVLTWLQSLLGDLMGN